MLTNRIIFHHSLSTFGDACMIRSWHLQRGFSEIGYHFVILTNGKIEPGRHVSLVGAHAFGKNFDSIGVCLIGDFRRSEPFTDQIESSQRLYHGLCRSYGKSLGIDYHRELTEENPCPGMMFDRADFEEIVLRADPYRT